MPQFAPWLEANADVLVSRSEAANIFEMIGKQSDEGSISFPDPTECSAMAIRIIEVAYDSLLGGLPFPVREWCGSVPRLDRGTLLTATADATADHPELPTCDFLGAFAEAMRWIGIE